MTQQSFQPHPLAFQSHGVPSSTSNRNQVRRPQKTALFLSSPDVTSSSGFIHSTISSTNELISSTTATPTTTTFEPIMPDTTALAGFASIVLVCVVAGWVWANQVVPVSRTKLALSKKNGPVKDYLDELRASESAMTATTTNYLEEDMDTSSMLTTEENTTATLLSSNNDTTTTAPSSDRAFERWLFTDWLDKPPSQGGRQKEPALPVLKDAKWNSGDNPVLAATALIMGGVLVTAVVERVSSLLG